MKEFLVILKHQEELLLYSEFGGNSATIENLEEKYGLLPR